MNASQVDEIQSQKVGLWSQKLNLIAGLILIIGCILRLSFGEDIEFKSDELFNFNYGMSIGKTSPWGWVGMNSSAGVVNPGLSVWVFPFLARLVNAQTPVELARAVQVSNCLALAVLLVFALSIQSAWEKKVWIWGAAIAAVNPISIILHRKIWCQSVLPIFSMFFCLGLVQKIPEMGRISMGILRRYSWAASHGWIFL